MLVENEIVSFFDFEYYPCLVTKKRVTKITMREAIRQPSIYDARIWFHEGELMKNHTNRSDEYILKNINVL